MSRVQTVQQTGKLWKVLSLFGFLAMAGGLAYCFVTQSPAGGVVAGVGVPVWLAGKAGAWWFHG
jgi:hypothetical protein